MMLNNNVNSHILVSYSLLITTTTSKYRCSYRQTWYITVTSVCVMLKDEGVAVVQLHAEKQSLSNFLASNEDHPLVSGVLFVDW